MILSNCIAQVSTPYSVAVLPKKHGWDDLAIQFSVGNELRLSVTGQSQTVFVIASNVLYVAIYCYFSDDCSVSAFDLRNSQQLWQTRLNGLMGVTHSEYFNQVQIQQTPTLIAIRGRESSGDYAECLDRQTGKIVGHRIFRHYYPKGLKQLNPAQPKSDGEGLKPAP